MKNILLYVLLSFCCNLLKAQEPEIFKDKGYTLTFTNNAANFNPALKQKMVDAFFKVYPVLAKDFNVNTLKEVTFSIDTAYKGVAATSRGKVVYNPEWFKKNPGDLDVVTHEVMHIVQNYGNTNGPGWLTEGIADYVRYKYGVDNEGANWKLPALKPEHSYNNSYRITARFLNWLELNGNGGIVKKLDIAMRNHTYKEELWKEIAGKTLTELWSAYAVNSNL